MKPRGPQTDNEFGDGPWSLNKREATTYEVKNNPANVLFRICFFTRKKAEVINNFRLSFSKQGICSN
jgi:hypothetical protein